MALHTPQHRRGRLRPALLVLALALACSAYVVEPGDTLSELAGRFGVTVGDLARANNLADRNRVIAGRSLEIPGSAPSRAHTVAGGESLSAIAARYDVDVAGLAAANGIEHVDLVREGARLVVPAPGQAAASGGPPARSASRADIGVLLEDTARRYGVDPALVKAVAWQESGWNPGVVSSAGAVGVMQVLPSTGRFVSSSLVGRSLDLTDPADNVEAGVAFLDYLTRQTGGDARAALGGYYQGLRSVRLRGTYPDTVQYQDNVEVLRRRFS